MNWQLGATYRGEGRCEFVVWAPHASKVEVHLVHPQDRIVPLAANDRHYYHAVVEDVHPKVRYMFRLNGEKERPDPASRSQPEGVHGPSEVVEPDFPWEDSAWPGLSLPEHILYEIHTGTFTLEGTLEAAIQHLDRLRDTGITAVELMPLGQFPGDRNWGYDGTYPFSVQNSYGGIRGLKKFVNACHLRSMAVVLDVIYNHLGPEGNYLAEFAPYFTDRYRTPWGPAVNFDGPWSDEVRYFFISSALAWLTDFHIDALRLDAIHAIVDTSARPFLQELGEVVHTKAKQLGRSIYLIPESDRNDSRFVTPRCSGGMGLDAQWNDDFHHAVHALLTGENTGYYQDFGQVSHLRKAFTEGYVYTGDYSTYRRRRHGNSSRNILARQFVVFTQNHDQVGNRMAGDRLTQLVSFDALKLAAGVVLLSPFIPLLFMGEEYGETAPFQFFVSHLDPQVIEATRKGRREEFSAFRWKGEPPDPQDKATFLRSKLHPELSSQGNHRLLAAFYKELIRLRKTFPPLKNLSKDDMEVREQEDLRCLWVRRWFGNQQALMVFNFNEELATISCPAPGGEWCKRLESSEEQWGGSGSVIPGTLFSEGELLLTLSGWSFAAFTSGFEIEG